MRPQLYALVSRKAHQILMITWSKSFGLSEVLHLGRKDHYLVRYLS